jgi:two-component system sensor histidine kinase QseC
VNEEALRIVLANLFDNASHHCPRGSSIVCELACDEREVRVAVSNDSEGLRTEDLERLGEPFWRADEARSKRDHFGLGLALARECATAAGIGLSFALDGRRLRAIVTIARTPARPSP